MALLRQGRLDEARPLLESSLEAMDSTSGLTDFAPLARERLERFERLEDNAVGADSPDGDSGP